MADKAPVSILLVEDDDIDILNVQRAFKKIGIPNALHLAHNGDEALNLLRGTNGFTKLSPFPRIVLLDINMPLMNGLEFLKELRNDSSLKHLSVFILTTSSDHHDLIDAYNLNVAGYVVKPLDFEKFTTTITTLYHYWELCEFPQQ
jgi:CheY-like chemotaxis protein